MQVLKRNIAVIALAGLVLGGGGIAWARGSAPRPTLVGATQATQTDPTAPDQAPPTGADREARRAAHEAKRAEVRACMEAAGEDAAARQACLAAAGFPGRLGAHRPGAAGPRHHGHAGGPLGILGRAAHGTAVVPGDGDTWQTVTFDRGRVNDATDGSKVVLDRPDGVQVTLALGAGTRYLGIADAAGIRKGSPAMVVSKDGTATVVAQKDPARAKRPRAGNNDAAPVVPSD